MRAVLACVQVLADVVPKVKHYFVLELRCSHIATDEEFSHLFVLAVGGFSYLVVEVWEVFKPMVVLTVHIECEICLFLFVVNLDILHFPTAFERRVHREEALVGGVHRGVDVQVGRKANLIEIIKMSYVAKIFLELFFCVYREF